MGPDKNSPAPAFTTRVDYFQSTAEGPMPEDLPLLAIQTIGGGSVTTNPPIASLACGDTVNLTAVPGRGWQFASWSGDAVGAQNPLSMLMNRPRSVTATFTDLGTRYIMLPMIKR